MSPASHGREITGRDHNVYDWHKEAILYDMARSLALPEITLLDRRLAEQAQKLTRKVQKCRVAMSCTPSHALCYDSVDYVESECYKV